MTANTSKNTDNAAGIAAWTALTDQQKLELANTINVIDSAPVIGDIRSLVINELYFAAKRELMESLASRLEAWWLGRCVDTIQGKNDGLILSNELYDEITVLRAQFEEENLPIDDDIVKASVDAAGYQDRVFVRQLKLIDLGEKRILQAIRDYYRAFEQRSRWVREDLLLVGDLDRYDDHLREEWSLRFEQMRDDLGSEAAEDQITVEAKKLYTWVENGPHQNIRPMVTHTSIPRGSYQMLSDSKKIGWHMNFLERLELALAVHEVEHE